MLVVFLITGVFILLGILYIFHLKREIRRIIEWIEHNEHIYSVNVLDKDIENLALSINKRIKEDERKEHQLKKQDKNFKKMVANLSHDLRTPLTVIIGYLQLIRLEKNVNEPVNSYIEHIENKADYLKKLVDDLYLLFWSEAIESEVDMKSVNITEVVTSLLKEYIQNSKRASEQLDIRLPHGNIWILAQEKILIRILCNLIDNALKYSTGDIMFYMWGESEYCHIQISNPSDYISDEELKSIFDLFYTKDEARIKSSGIGLYATRKLVIQISGDIQVNYEAGIFTVSIKLPLI